MYVRNPILLNEVVEASTAGGAADASAAAAAGAADAGATPTDGASGGAAAQPGSLMARGAAGAADAGASAAAADAATGAQGDAAPAFPDKYLVKREDGTTDWEASALKQAQGYTELSKLMGTAERPPKTPEEYAPELPAGVTLDMVKGDPLFAGFLKGAHAKGLTNGQVSYILGEFQQRMVLHEEQRNNPAIAEAELQKVWGTPQQMQIGLRDSFRAAKSFAVDDDHAARIDKKFGNDPDFIRLMAKIGGELGEDKPVGGLSPVETETLDSLKQHPAYFDAKHPEHKLITAKVTALYNKLHPS